MKLIEIKPERQYYGNDGDAINKHSVRYYFTDQVLSADVWREVFILDRCTDIHPRFFTCYEASGRIKYGILKFENMKWRTAHLYKELQLGNDKSWGSDLTWKQAEEKLLQFVVKQFELARSW